MSSTPTVFGRYQLIEPVAKGGMAEVFKARLAAAAGTEKLVCIKRILPHLSRNQEFTALFVKEAQIALPLNHGNITQVFDFGEQDGVYYLVMEYIEGQNLFEVLKRAREMERQLDLAAVLYVAVEVCKGLQYAHSYRGQGGKLQAVIHRDVTPHNILISYNGEVKLTDFGIAFAATKVSRKEERVVRGKACYLSPEQIDGQPGDPRSDVFSLGTVIYEMLSGVRPFEAATEEETLRRIRELKLEPPGRHNSEVDSGLDQLVLRAMARDPAQRFQQVAELQVALSQLLHRRCPDFTASTLAASLQELFGWEIAQLEGQGGDAARDRLLFQLSRAGVKIDPGKATTSDLLEMGTVAIAGGAPRREPPRWRRLAPWIGAGGAALLLFVGGLALWSIGGASSGGDAGADLERTPPPALSTEHLVPLSIQAPTEAEPPPQAPGKGRPSQAATGAQAQAQRAFLNCNSWPWSVVFLNGRRLPGNTPLFRVKVPAGKHRLRFSNPELGLSKEVAVTLTPGETKTVAISLQQ